MYIYDHIAFPSSYNEVFQTKVVETIKTRIYFMFSAVVLRAVYEIMGKNILETDRPQMTIWCMRIACRIPKAINTDSEYVILIAFSLQQWLYERASVLCYTCVVCLV